MATLIEATSGREAYVQVVETVRRRGHERPSRNGVTIELPDVTVALTSPGHALPLGCRPGLSRKIAAAEALQLIGGFSNPEWLIKLAPQFKRYLEPNGHFHGAYGERRSYGLQLPAVVRKLREDPSTRQAVVTLWDPALDNVPGKLDYPCTVGLGFSRGETWGNEQLNMRVTMRSNDVWLGLPYDMFQFAQLQLTLCNVLDLIPGTYTHTAWSMHIYRSDLEATYDVTEPPRYTSDEKAVEPGGIGERGDSFEHVEETAIKIANDYTFRHNELTWGEQWFYDAIHG